MLFRSQQEENNKKISILDFDKTTLDLGQYEKKTPDYYKFNEMFFLELLKKTLDKNDYQRLNSLGELNDRIIMPLFIPSLIILGLFLIITNKEIINYNYLKLIIFITGILIIIASEILLDLSSKHFWANLVLYLSPFFFLLLNWILLNYILNRENKNSYAKF